MRVRTLLITCAVLALIAGVIWAFHTVTSTTPLGAGAASVDTIVPVAPHGQETWQVAEPVYQWSAGRSIKETLWLSNSGRFPITVTGVDQTTPSDWGGNFAGPVPFLWTQPNANGRPIPFHPVHIPAHGGAVIGLRFYSNPEPCREVPRGGGGMSAQDTVTFRFTVLSVFHDSQQVALIRRSRCNARRRPVRSRALERSRPLNHPSALPAPTPGRLGLSEGRWCWAVFVRPAVLAPGGDGLTSGSVSTLRSDLHRLCRPSPPEDRRRDLIGAWHRPH